MVYVVMLSVIMLNVVVLSVVMLSLVTLFLLLSKGEGKSSSIFCLWVVQSAVIFAVAEYNWSKKGDIGQLYKTFYTCN